MSQIRSFLDKNISIDVSRRFSLFLYKNRIIFFILGLFAGIAITISGYKISGLYHSKKINFSECPLCSPLP